MKTFKKAVILSSMLLCSCIQPIESTGFQNMSVSAADSSTLSDTVSSDFKWVYDKESKTLTFSGKGHIVYNEDQGWIDFASEIKNIVVSDGITSFDMKFSEFWPSVDTLSLGKDFTGISSIRKILCNNYIVSSEHPEYSVYDGMICSKDQTKLIAVPSKKTEFHFPSTLTSIAEYAFFYTKASVIILPEGITKIEGVLVGFGVEDILIAIPNTCKAYEYYYRVGKYNNATDNNVFYLYSNSNTELESYFEKGHTLFSVINKAWGRVGYKTYDEIYSGSTTPTSYGWKEVSNWTFFLTKDGLQDKGWVYENGSLYYFSIYEDTSGKYTGAHQIDNTTYTFDDNGRLIDPIPESVTAISAETFETVTVSGFNVTPGTNLSGIVYKDGKASYYKDGKKLASQWVEAGGNYYYLNDSGVSVVNCWRIKDGKYRYLGSDGKMKTNTWIKDYNNWYYVKADGTRYESCWAKLNGYWYWFGGSGKMMANGWLKMANGKWYYFNVSGAMAASRWIKSGNKWYYVDVSGTMVTNHWIKSSGKWYYLGSSGAMLTNTKTPDGYRVDKNGVWVK